MSKTVSAAKGKGSMRHNNRTFAAENVDQERSHLNTYYKQEPLKVAYRKCFAEAIEVYNDKQKRSDRKIDGVSGYMQKIKESGNGEKLFYETIFQIGNQYDTHSLSEDGKLCQQILDEYMKEFEKRNPHLYVFNAVLHMDEATPHLHIDYIPIADGYKQGMQKRNSLDKALKQQGIDGKSNKTQNSTIAWENREKDYIEKLMKERGLERTPETGLKRKHKTVQHYKETVAEIENQVQAVELNVAARPNKFNKDEVIIKKDELDSLVERAKLVTVHKEASQQLQQELTAKVNDFTTYSNQQQQLIEQMRANAAVAEKAAKEKEKAAELAKQQYEEKYNSQLTLNEDHTKLKNTANQVYKAYTAQKQQIEELKKSIDTKVAEAVKPLNETIEKMKDKMESMALGQSTLMRAIRYVRDNFISESSLTWAVLNATIKKNNEWLAEDGFQELSQNRDSYISKGIGRNLQLDLKYKSVDGVKGLYNDRGSLMYEVDSIADARERFPNCNIKNELEKGISR